MKRDGATTSLWQKNVPDYQPAAVSTDKNREYDVVIIGGGITGLSTALLLQQYGKSCLVAEARNIGYGTTGGTTAHINTFFETPYHKVIRDFGETNAKLLVKGAQTAMSLINSNVTKYGIDCSFEKRDAYIFSMNEDQDKELEDIINACQKLGLPADFINDSPFPIPYLKIGCIRDQAQFHPTKYLSGLAKAFEKAGGVILQDCRVMNIKEGDSLEIETTAGTLNARNAVYATHIPPGVNQLHFMCAPYRSYVLGVKLKEQKNYPVALGYDMHDPYHYYRTQEVDGEYYLVAGGEDHKTGHEDNTETCFRRLESHVRSHFEVESIAFRWSSQFFDPADGLAYIGNLPGSTSNIYVATGFGGIGMVYGSLSAVILSDMIVKGKSDYQDLFNPNRIKPVAGFSKMVKEGADVVKHFIADRFSIKKMTELADMAPGEGKLVKYNGHSIALHKDEEGNLHAVNPACTHIKCTVGWNSVERSWDCPCHGSRFSMDGTVLTGPAQKALQQVDLTGGEEVTGD